MKRLIFLIWLLFILILPAQVFGAAAMIHAGDLTGGSADDLDAVECEDIVGDDTNRAIATGDRAMVVTTSGTYIYRYDATGTDAENSPTIIVPDDRATDCGGTGQWNLQGLTTVINPSDISLNQANVIVGNSSNVGAATAYIPNIVATVDLEDADCTAADEPFDCCTGAGTGSCDDIMSMTDGIDGIACGEGSGGSLVAQWDTVYYDGTDKEWKEADADAAGEFPAAGLATADGTDGTELVILTKGCVRNDAWNWTSFGPEGWIYLSDTAGSWTQTAPSTSGDCVQIIGWAVSDDVACFDFSRPYQEVE